MMALRELFFKTGFLNLQKSKRSLQVTLGLLAVFLIIPIFFLISQTYSQLEREAFFMQRTNAEGLLAQIDQRAYELIRLEEERKFEDYSFLHLSRTGQSGYLRLSPLASIPPITAIPGVIGYFQIEPDGRMSSPILPEDVIDARNYGISREEYRRRRELINQMKSILTSGQFLSQNAKQRILQTPAIPQKEVDAVFDETAFDEPALKELEEALSPGKNQKSSPKVFNNGNNKNRTKVSDLELDSPIPEDDVAEMPEANSKWNYRAKKRPQRKTRQIEVSIVRQRIQIKNGIETREVGRGKLYFQPRQRKLKGQNEGAPSSRTQRQSVALDSSRNGKVDSTRDSKKAEASQWNSGKASQSNRSQWKPYPTSNANSSNRLNNSGQNELAEDMRINRPKLPGSSPIFKPMNPEQWSKDNQILKFKGEMDPFQLTLLDSGEVIFYRRVWRDEQRFIQGFILDRKSFLNTLFEQSYLNSALSKSTDLILAYKGGVLKRFESEPEKSHFQAKPSKKREILLLRSSLSPPFNDLEALFTIKDLPNSPGHKVVNLLATIVVLVLLGGLFFIYRLALNQLEFAKQRSDFVSAVSHELKTPLTSIRMYGEMLRDGYVNDPEKQRGYFDFIYFESERLSRLISNVLQLAKLSNEEPKLDLQSTTPKAIMDFITSKVQPQVDAAQFKLNVKVDEEDLKRGSEVIFDCENDAISQIFINFIDNAIKFSRKVGANEVDIGYRIKGQANPEVIFFVRDYGPGVPKDQRKKIFQLFYRSGDEMTRTTPGTGIGLALVSQLAQGLKANVDLKNQDKGAEFQIKFSSHRPEAKA